MKQSEVMDAQVMVLSQLKTAGIVVDPNEAIEIADFGLGHWRELGLGLIVRVNEPEYCSKWLTLVPGQECPAHFHKLKKETFFCLSGEVRLLADDKIVHLTPGEKYTVLPGVSHSFGSLAGAVIEEVSTHDENSDSYFADPSIVRSPIVEDD